MRRLIAAVAVTAALLAAGGAAGRSEHAAAGPQSPPAKEPPLHKGGYLNAYIAMLKSDLKSRRANFIREGLRLDEKEAAAFWPIYKDYEADLKKVDDTRQQLVQDLMDNYGTMSDAKAKELIKRKLATEGQRVEVKRAYFKRFEKILPGKTLARFLQLEYRFGLLIDLKNTADIPLIE